MSLEETDAASAAVAKRPRVALDDIRAAIERVSYCSGHDLRPEGGNPRLRTLTVCLVTMKNGFMVIGKAAPASPENYNPELGQKFAYEDAIRQIWPLMAYALCDRLYS